MFGKLLKFEFKATSKIIGILFAVLAGFSLLSFGSILLVSRLAGSESLIFGLISGTTITFVLLAASVVMAFPTYYGAWRFYKNLVGDEGYLMHMLPVSTSSLIFSKALVLFIWNILASVLGIGAIVLIYIGFFGVLQQHFDPSLFPQINIGELLANLPITFGAVFMIFQIILCLLALFAFSTLSLYLCIAIGQLWTAHRLLGAILSYIGLSVILESVSTVGQILLLVFIPQNLNLTSFNIVLLLCNVAIIAATAACGFFTVRIFKYKLNLQ